MFARFILIIEGCEIDDDRIFRELSSSRDQTIPYTVKRVSFSIPISRETGTNIYFTKLPFERHGRATVANDRCTVANDILFHRVPRADGDPP